MSITPADLVTLMREVEIEDPIDFAALPFDEEALRALVANHLCEMAQSMQQLTVEERLMTLLAAAGKLVLENLVLHTRLLSERGQPIDANVEALLGRLRKS